MKKRKRLRPVIIHVAPDGQTVKTTRNENSHLSTASYTRVHNPIVRVRVYAIASFWSPKPYVSLKRTSHPHVLSPSYTRTTPRWNVRYEHFQILIFFLLITHLKIKTSYKTRITFLPISLIIGQFTLWY
jgi:hypothetical protein